MSVRANLSSPSEPAVCSLHLVARKGRMASDRLRRRGVIERWRSEGDTRTVRGPGFAARPARRWRGRRQKGVSGCKPVLFDRRSLLETARSGFR